MFGEQITGCSRAKREYTLHVNFFLSDLHPTKNQEYPSVSDAHLHDGILTLSQM